MAPSCGLGWQYEWLSLPTVYSLHHPVSGRKYQKIGVSTNTNIINIMLRMLVILDLDIMYALIIYN